MRTGIIVRANQRGLGYQTYDAWKNYGFDETLLVLDHSKRWPEDHTIYAVDGDTPDWVAYEDHRLPFRGVMSFLERIDVLFTVETAYDPMLPSWAYYQKCGVVIQGNPEFVRREEYFEEPTWTWPTRWLLNEIPEGPVVPVPVPWLWEPQRYDKGPLRVLMPGGHAAKGDRNGTQLFLDAMRSIGQPMHIRVTSQDGDIGRLPKLGTNIELEQLPFGTANRQDLYRDIDVVVIPRRYGGLCLPAQEALASGCVLVMTDCQPNTDWPIIPIPSSRGRGESTPHGVIQTAVARGNLLGRILDDLYRDRARLHDLKVRSYNWARTHTWDALRGVYTGLLEDAAGGR